MGAYMCIQKYVTMINGKALSTYYDCDVHAYMCIDIQISDIINRSLVFCLVMTACDISSTAKPWEVHNRCVNDLFIEFYKQVQLLYFAAICMLL